MNRWNRTRSSAPIRPLILLLLLLLGAAAPEAVESTVLCGARREKESLSPAVVRVREDPEDMLTDAVAEPW